MLSEHVFRRKPVMCAAQQSQILRMVRAASSEWFDVIELEIFPALAPCSIGCDERALSAVSHKDHVPDFVGNVSGLGAIALPTLGLKTC